MDRFGRLRPIGLVLVVLLGALPLGLVAVLRAFPPLLPADAGLAWVPAALTAGLVIAAGTAAVAALVDGLRRGNADAFAEAGMSAALAGGAIGVLITMGSGATALLAASVLLLGAVLARERVPLPAGRRTRIAAAAGVLVAAEAAVLADLLPVLETNRVPLLVVAAGVSAVAMVASRSHRDSLIGGLLALGAAGVLAARGASFEMVVGLAALLASQLVTVISRPHRRAEPGSDVDRLPELANRLSDAVLRFDGGLRLRDWNQPAVALLGLDAASAGIRLEDLLGVRIAELPARDGTVISRGAVGGLEIAMHGSGDGITAVIRDPTVAPEAERVGLELRTTIEELLRARRTIELQRGELERSSTVDPLTGVASRGAILERLRIEVAQARRYRHPLAVVLLDIDQFGEVNRLHGIDGGDAVLREVALRIRLRVREADALGRAGSDGFIAALPHTDEGGAATFADALRRRVGLRPISVGDDLVAVSVSIGVATMRPGEDLDVDGLMGRVQEALDSARSSGGDRVALDRRHGLARLEERHPDGDSVADPDVRGV